MSRNGADIGVNALSLHTPFFPSVEYLFPDYG